MSAYKNFAILGAGNLGKYLVEELLKAKIVGTIASVLVVSRTKVDNPEWTAQGAKFVVVDYDTPASFATVFDGVDIVISTLGVAALNYQSAIAEAAKSTYCKLFIPSEFGMSMENDSTGGPFAMKQNVLNKLKEINLPSTIFYTGLFTDFAFVPPLGFDFANGKVDIGGTGNTPVSFTSRSDIARYVTHVLTTLPGSKLEGRIFRIEGDRLTFNEIIAGYEKKTGKKIDLSHTSQDALKENIVKNPHDFLSDLRLSWDLGHGTIGGNGETDNGLWPEWNPKKVLDILA